MRFLTTLLLIITLVGCVSIPDTEIELKTNAYRVDTYCSPLDFKKTYDVVAENTARCHALNESAVVPAAGLFIPLSTQDIVKGEVITPNTSANISVEYKNPVEGGFLQSIEIDKTRECPVLVSVFVLNDTTKWITASESVPKWLRGDNENCFELF